ncbi:spirocyclase AveC family protein [Sporichthya sp.]|uniref:spirocyclase AveC family protein n=1 Tax=Sporichthya sp. TaxID=65475 RepID=UPI0017B0BD62|nr:spirocyclase AveC family protein [Sporichthya sp.]MBA3743283.1 spirocyclase AveC family protein [Sporichthya sp.]
MATTQLTDQGRTSVLTSPNVRSKRLRWAVAGVGIAVFVWLMTFTSTGGSDPRIHNPEQPSPLPGNGMWGLSGQFWIYALHTATVIMCLGMVFFFLRNRRRTGVTHPAFALFIGLSTIIAYDPIFNWAMYAVYNPELRHYPVTWEWAKISPSVEPLWPLGAYPFFFLTPGLITFALFKRYVEPRAKAGSFVDRRPMWSLFLFSLVGCTVMEVIGETLLLQMEIWTYYQYWGPAFHVGDSWLPLTEIVLASLTMSLLSVMLHRDDHGRSVATRLSASVRPLRAMRFGEKATAVLILQAVFIAYIGFYAVVRLAGLDTNISGDYPYRTIKTYDPDGYVQEAGIPGPYYKGVWVP